MLRNKNELDLEHSISFCVPPYILFFSSRPKTWRRRICLVNAEPLSRHKSINRKSFVLWYYFLLLPHWKNTLFTEACVYLFSWQSLLSSFNFFTLDVFIGGLYKNRLKKNCVWECRLSGFRLQMEINLSNKMFDVSFCPP